MKIKTDFVTNSSSTSFIIMSKGEFNKDDFLNLMGVEKESDFYDMVCELYYEVSANMEDASEYYNNEYLQKNFPTTREFIIDEFSEEVFEKYREALANGDKIYIGKLHSESGFFISFVCTDCFIEENEKIYLNYTNCGW